MCKVPETQASLERTAEPTAKREEQSKEKYVQGQKADLEVCEVQQDAHTPLQLEKRHVENATRAALTAVAPPQTAISSNGFRCLQEAAEMTPGIRVGNARHGESP